MTRRTLLLDQVSGRGFQGYTCQREEEVQKREFTVAHAYRYNTSGPVRWIVSHVMRYPWIPIVTVLMATLTSVLSSTNSVLVGRAFDVVLSPGATRDLVLGAARLSKRELMSLCLPPAGTMRSSTIPTFDISLLNTWSRRASWPRLQNRH